ncbi:unnamed protein product [Kuraishia capsulata CBS 1993]|uniref:Amino acid permease/ SLC12A domain-containing protein n=1 Tax=Kuraishia capsulata CBS 1993 TaxID=1382522 RepID=W6MF06_9ASCO|nr:uncharacterized protein KUCA_T00000014001 [Kuraishia capsulata CBS 1993]CDK24054.1 unnamed protein product [Kuraishia capsulata CBS 1993]
MSSSSQQESSKNTEEKSVGVRVLVDDYEEGEVGMVPVEKKGDGEVELEKNFSLLTVVGLVYSSFATPIALGTYLSLVVGVGGAPFFFYSYLMCGVFSLLTAYSMAELASVHPHASALVLWTQLFASPKYSRVLTYFTGFISCASWIFASCAAAFFQADLILAMASMCFPNYVIQDWHTYLVFLAASTFALGLNTFSMRGVALLANSMNYVINGGTIFIFVALLARAFPKQPAEYVFKEVVNETGWGSKGVVFFLSITPSVSAVAVFDGACHLTDEVPNPKKNIPLVLTYGYTAATFIGLISVIIYMFCIVNPENLLAPVGGQPFFQLFEDSMHSKPLSIISALFVTLTFVGGTNATLTSTSRLVMAFARFGSLPYGKAIGSVNRKFKTPGWAILFVYVWMILLGLLIFASSAALNAVMGSFLTCMFVSYCFPFISLVLTKDRYGEGVKPLFNLGKWGRPINIICIFWFMFASGWLCVPSYVPVTANGMNYTVVVLTATIVVATVNWVFFARKHFHFVAEVDESQWESK